MGQSYIRLSLMAHLHDTFKRSLETMRVCIETEGDTYATALRLAQVILNDFWAFRMRYIKLQHPFVTALFLPLARPNLGGQ